jgi:hypothetical protein
MTKNELKSALTAANVSFAKKANLETLQALYDALPKGVDLSKPELEPKADAPTPPAPVTHDDVAAALVAQGTQAPPAPEAPAPAPTDSTGLKIEKDRPEQNGIKRPSIGGKCRAIWDALDAFRAETGELPTSKTVKELAADEGWNPNNASIEYYQWRKFHGISKQA